MRNTKYDYIRNEWRLKVDDEILQMIGLELKRRRIMHSKNLNDYDCDVSISYLSKIENAKIIPKFSVLKDFCAQNGIQSDELNYMLQIDDRIKRVIDAIVENNKKYIQDEFFKVKIFNNYKFSLFKALYYYFF